MLEENAKVGKKYIVVIPSKIRRKIGLKEGEMLRVRLEENQRGRDAPSSAGRESHSDGTAC